VVLVIDIVVYLLHWNVLGANEFVADAAVIVQGITGIFLLRLYYTTRTNTTGCTSTFHTDYSDFHMLFYALILWQFSLVILYGFLVYDNQDRWSIREIFSVLTLGFLSSTILSSVLVWVLERQYQHTKYIECKRVLCWLAIFCSIFVTVLETVRVVMVGLVGRDLDWKELTEFVCAVVANLASTLLLFLFKSMVTYKENNVWRNITGDFRDIVVENPMDNRLTNESYSVTE